VIDGALGQVSPEDLGSRLLYTAQRLIDRWDRPLRDVGVLLPAISVNLPWIPTADSSSSAAAACDGNSAGSRLGSVALTWNTGGDDLSSTDGAMTYRELDEAADRMAAAL
ncbi:hypothetical protein C6A85_72410, partial [Mycobacterium sp. ITM-2017-0098]